MSYKRIIIKWFFFSLLGANSATYGQNKALEKFANDNFAQNYVCLFGKTIKIQNCYSVSNSENRIFLTSQSGAYSFNGKSTQKIPFGKSFDSLFEIGNSKKLTYNENAQQLACCYPKHGIAILNRAKGKSYFQLVQIDGFNPAEEVSGLEYVGGKFVLVTVSKLIIFTIELTPKTGLYEAKVFQQLEFIAEGILGICKTRSNGFAIITTQKNLKIFAPGKNGKYNETLSIHLPQLDGVVELFTLKNDGDKYFAGTSNGLYTFSINGSTVKSDKGYLPGQPVYSTCFMSDSSFYIAGSKGLFKVNKYGQLSEVEEANNQQDKTFLSTVYDIYAKNNMVWLASQEGIAMFDHRGTPFYAVKNTSYFKPNHVYQIGEDMSNSITLSCENGLYNYSKPGVLSALKNEDTYFLSAKTPDNRQLVSTINHSYIQNGNSLISVEKIYSEFIGFEGLSFNDFEYTDEGNMILSTENEFGVYKWDYTKKKVQRIDENTSNPKITQVNNLYKNGRNVFILTDDNVYRYSAGGLKKYEVLYETKHLGIFFDMLEVKGHYFLASYDNGVIETDNEFRVIRIFNTNNGLSDNGVYRLASVGDSILLVSSNNGLNAINLGNDRVKVFTEEDGLHSNVFEEFSSYQKDGKIYFGGKNGFTIVSPEKMNFSISTFNNLHFTNCKVINDKNISTTFEIDDTGKVFFSNKTTQVTISFNNLIYPYKERIKYSYKIVESHNYWIELGNTNFVTLPVMNPDTYHLQVKAANEDGVWSEPKELILIFLPKWYQTWWFRLLVFLVTAGIIYAFYRYRIQQIKKQHEIRRNIANDLHDDLGSTLNSVKVFTNLAISGVNQNESLQQVKQNLNEATSGLRDMLWVLDDSLDTVDELVTRLKQFALPVASAAGINATITAGSDVNSRKLTKEEKRNLYLICKEAINNAIKYSGATEINVAITPSGKKIQITIADNGKGFDVAAASKGYGLKNMEYRAGQVGYKVSTHSGIEQGTKIEVKPV